MSNLKAELFIRKHIQSILLREEKEEEKKEDKPKGRGKVLGGIGRGDIPKWVKEIFAGEDGSAAKAKRLASVNPGKLAQNLKLTSQAGMSNADTVEQAYKIMENARKSNESFQKAIGSGEEKEGSDGKKGYFFSNDGLETSRQSTLFVFDTIRAAAALGYIDMKGHIRIEPMSGGTIMHQARDERDRWQ